MLKNQKMYIIISLSIICYVCFAYKRGVIQQMDKGKGNPFHLSSEILKEYKKMKRRERYLYEKDKGRLIRFDEAYIVTGSTSTIEDFISKRNLHIALLKALNELDEVEYEIIQDCFFTSKKVNYAELSKKYSISYQAYVKRLDKILAKLKKLVTLYYEEF